MRAPVLFLLTACMATAMLPAQGVADQSSAAYPASWADLLHRAGNGHSPTPEEIAAAGSPVTQPDGKSVKAAVPLIRNALAYPDAQVRAFALAALIGLQVPPTSAEEKPVTPIGDQAAPQAAVQAVVGPKSDAPTAPPTAFRLDIAVALAPILPELGKELTDDVSTNRILAATALSGFASKPPDGIDVPLLAYLRRDDGTGPVGVAVVDDLLLLGPLSTEAASGIIRYLRRTDQTADTRSSLIESVAGHSNQNQSVDQALVAYLSTDDPAVRARLILSLPQLDLAPDVFADTRSRVSILAADDQENPQVIRAAKAVVPCWTATRMSTGCPVN